MLLLFIFVVYLIVNYLKKIYDLLKQRSHKLPKTSDCY